MKSLAKDTAIYGLSSIVGRFLNYLLVPLYTHVIAASSGGYGVVTNLYAYVALILVILTFGMETTFFRFANKEDENPHLVFSTSMAVVGTLSAIFLAVIFLGIDPIANALQYSDHKEYILMMATVVALDAIQAIPFSYLRYKQNAIKFAALKLLFIILNIGLNLLYFVFLGKDDVFYVFFLNLVCTGFITFFFIPEFWHEHVAARQYCRDNFGVGHSRHTEPDGRQDDIPAGLSRQDTGSGGARHLWCLCQDSHDYGDDYPGFPLCLRTHRLC